MTKQQDGVHVLSTGVRVRFRQVPADRIIRATASVKDPVVPVVEIPDKGKEENPLDPGYLEAVAETNRKRTTKIMRTLARYGMELADGRPAEEEWLPEIQTWAKKEDIDISEYDVADEYDLDVMYKTMVCLGGQHDYDVLARNTGVSQEGIDEAIGSFPGNQERGADQATRPEEAT